MIVLNQYRGRLAPSPTGYLHMGHARTFFVAWRRARAAGGSLGGSLIFRNEDLDYQRCKPEFVQAMYDDLHWLGLDWDEGDNLPPQHGKSRQAGGTGMGGDFGPYSQSQRRSFYLDAWRKLRDGGFIYPCTCSRKDLERALSAPHEEEPSRGDEPLQKAAPDPRGPQENADDELPYPGTCRSHLSEARDYDSPAGVSWRFKVPDGRAISFTDLHFGPQTFTAGKDFSDFLVWRRDDIPAYQLAVVADDAAMQITEVVRGADLLRSTARQLLLFEALRHAPPQYFHCPLLRDENNIRLAKRNDALSLRTLRENGVRAEELREKMEEAYRGFTRMNAD